jgi:alpha-beta hydrolase superfamily lysophospholipase
LENEIPWSGLDKARGRNAFHFQHSPPNLNSGMRLPDVQERQRWLGRALLWAEVLVVTAFLIYRIYVWLETPLPPPAPTQATANGAPVIQPERTEVKLQLKRGEFTIFRYVPGDPAYAASPKALIIFGSGDGGFDGWENRVCQALQQEGYEMLGFDCAAYAKTDYDLDTLQTDMNTIAQSSLSKYPDHATPLILGGWSMGAEQAVAAAGGPHPPKGVGGLLLISPGDRGRYGLRTPDRWNVTPTGAGTFGLVDFAQKLGQTRVAQWNGNLDLMGSKAWLPFVTAPHRQFDFSYGLHDYNGASDAWLALLNKSIAWVLAVPANAPEAPVNPGK